MCRLYGFRANEETKIECTLVHAQNALMVQSREDRAGYSHGHGWGIAAFTDHQLLVRRQAWAAYHGEHFQRAAAKVYARLVLAHVRRATVGPPSMENTHPFVHDDWAFAHNGTVSDFESVRDRFRAEMTAEHRGAIHGDTDSEHIFRLLMSRREQNGATGLAHTLEESVRDIAAWCREANIETPVALNILWAGRGRLLGVRWGRSLYYVERRGIYDCEICGFPHIHHDARRDHRAIVLASEPITHENWKEIPDRSLFEIDENITLHVETLR